MRVLVVHHGALPAPGRPVSGGALRAWRIGRALQRAGHEVHWLTRAQDQPGGFASPAELALRARSLAPDRIVCVQLEEAPALGTLGLPLAVDLYAPRLLEAPFENAQHDAASAVMRALAAGDVFLASNARQRWTWLGVLALAGVDVRADPCLLVPLAAPAEAPAPQPPKGEPVLVAGGARWPWQDPVPALNRVLAVLDARGEGVVRWFGGAPLLGTTSATWQLPVHPRLQAPGWVAYDALLQQYATATLAIDWMQPNPERALALSFRHLDYLGCGLPILTGQDSALTDVLGDAGMATEDIEGALNTVLDNPHLRGQMSLAAQALAATVLDEDTAVEPLLGWINQPWRARREPSPLGTLADLARRAGAAEARLEHLEGASARAEAEVQHKRQELGEATGMVQELIRTNARLSRALDEVAGFKREAIATLGGQSEHARRDLADAERENGLLRADIEKKNAELLALDELRARLENDLRNVRGEVERLRRPRGLLSRGS